MLGKILPRHLQIIFEMNDYFLKTLQEQYPNDLPICWDGRQSLMNPTVVVCVLAWLAVVVSHEVNGLSELHSDLMVQSFFADFAKIFPVSSPTSPTV
ncbi:glycogen/starch/alpha-glucan phosphorylase [Shigella boydii]